jgi:hypothetical protein
MKKQIDTCLFDDDEECLEDDINKSLLNTSLDNHSTPRFPCYLKGDIMEVWMSGADVLYFDTKSNTLKAKLKTFKKSINLSLIKIPYLVKILNKINGSKDITVEESLISKFRILTSKSKLTDKQYKEIEKYESRKAGNW